MDEEKEAPSIDVTKALGSPAGSMEISAKTQEHPQDRHQRHELELLRLRHRHRLEFLYACLGMGIVVAITLFGMIAAGAAKDSDMRKGAMSLLPATLTGVLGFAAGRGLGKTREE